MSVDGEERVALRGVAPDRLKATFCPHYSQPRGRKPRSLKKKPGHTARHLPVQAGAVRSPFAATGDREPQAPLLAPQQEHVCPLGSDQGSQSKHPMGAGLPLFAPSLNHDRKPFAGASCRLTHCSESPSSCPPKAAVALACLISPLPYTGPPWIC